MRLGFAGIALALVSGLLSALGPPSSAAAPLPETDDPGRLVLVLDSSGSMKEPVAGGQTKLQAAKTALDSVVDELPVDAEVGARVFGAEVFSGNDPGACQDTQNVVPVGPLDREALKRAVAGYRAYGETPIGRALLGAAKDLGPSSPGESRTIVLLSDGEATCQPDPCTVAEKLDAQGIDLTINVVGLDVSGTARKALRCIARAGNGTYYDAQSADELATNLVKVSVRDVRGFVLTGDRVQGGESLPSALPLEPGTYLDTSRGDEKLRYYLLDKPPGGGVSVSALVRPPKGEQAWHTVLNVQLMTPAGDRCAYALEQSFQVVGRTPITSAGVELNQFTPTESDACEGAAQLVATVEVDAGVTDYRLHFASYPAIINADALPEAVSGGDEPWLANVPIPRRGATTPVAGGVALDDAPELSPGTTYTDSLLASEQTVYKIPVEYGQAVRVSARLSPDARADDVLGIQGNPTSLTLITSVGTTLSRAFDSDRGIDGGGFYNGAEPHLVTAAAPPVRVRNASASDSDISASTHDGFVYAVLGMGLLDNERPDDFAAPVRLRAELVGEPAGDPIYADATEASTDATASPSADADADADEQGAETTRSAENAADGSFPWLPLGGGTVALALLAGAALVLRSRRRPID